MSWKVLESREIFLNPNECVRIFFFLTASIYVEAVLRVALLLLLLFYVFIWERTARGTVDKGNANFEIAGLFQPTIRWCKKRGNFKICIVFVYHESFLLWQYSSLRDYFLAAILFLWVLISRFKEGSIKHSKLLEISFALFTVRFYYSASRGRKT